MWGRVSLSRPRCILKTVFFLQFVLEAFLVVVGSVLGLWWFVLGVGVAWGGCDTVGVAGGVCLGCVVCVVVFTFFYWVPLWCVRHGQHCDLGEFRYWSYYCVVLYFYFLSSSLGIRIGVLCSDGG